MTTTADLAYLAGIQFQDTKRANGGPGSRKKLTAWEIAERESFCEALASRSRTRHLRGVGPSETR